MQKVDVTHETPFWATSNDGEMFGATVQFDAVTVAGTMIGAADATGASTKASPAAKVRPARRVSHRVKNRT
jgi:hypothetical protein